jgi:hypothetical protein
MGKTVIQYIMDALRLCGQMGAPGRGYSPEQLGEIIEFLNQMLDSWNTMRNSIYSMTDTFLTLTSGQYQYTVGPGGQFDIPRPQAIQRANLIYQTSPQLLRLPVEIIDVDQWAAIRVPQLEAAIPTKLYYDYGYSQTTPFGLGQIYLWPAPQSAYQLEIFVWTLLNSALTMGDDLIYMPPGYARAITYNLAVEIMPLYLKGMNSEQQMRVERIAKESKNWVDSLNAPSPIVQIDPAVSSSTNTGFNWLVSTN